MSDTLREIIEDAPELQQLADNLGPDARDALADLLDGDDVQVAGLLTHGLNGFVETVNSLQTQLQGLTLIVEDDSDIERAMKRVHDQLNIVKYLNLDVLEAVGRLGVKDPERRDFLQAAIQTQRDEFEAHGATA